MKTCSTCNASKEAKCFSARTASPDGLSPKCKGCVSEYDKGRPQNTPAHRRAKRKYVENNPEENRASKKRWVVANRKEIQERNNIRYREDPKHRIKVILRARVGAALRGIGAKKSGPTFSLLGCSVVEFRLYLASLFRPGMTWENHGTVWEIDHIKPCSAFDLKDPEQQKSCFHWKNQQPLFIPENRKKSDHYVRTPELEKL